MQQRLGTTRLADGTTVAYATAGSGPPLLYVDGWLSHLELSWALPAERHLLEGLAGGRTLLRYDRPGCGLSGRSPRETVSMDRELETLTAVVDACGARPVDVLGTSLGVPVAVEWAARHPERVGRLVLYGGWVQGARVARPAVREHVLGLVAGHWGLGADVLTDIFAPDASSGTRAALAAYQRQASTAETAAALLALCYRVDVTRALGRVRAATLVLHRAEDRAAPLGQAREIAAGIPAARLRVLRGRSHVPYVGDVEELLAAVREFLGLPVRVASAPPALTTRQREVAALVAEGLTNREIARRLGIEERSAEGHLERIRLRLGLRSRAQVAAWWVGSGG